MANSLGAGAQLPDTVFVAIETKLHLAEYDERERLLAISYRQGEQQRKKREEKLQTQRKKLQTQGTINPATPADGQAGGDGDLGSDQEAGAPLNGQADGDLDSDEEAPGELSYCYKEIKNLVLIENSVIHKKALEEWARKENLFTARVDRKTKKVDSLKNEVYQLLGFFSVFQGVVLTAVSQSNFLHCNNLWSPVVLSVLASIVTIAAIAQKLWQISSFQKTISAEEQDLKDAVKRGSELRRAGKDFVFATFSKYKEKEPKKNYFWLYAGLVLSFLVLFTVAFPLSHWRILCHHGSA